MPPALPAWYAMSPLPSCVSLYISLRRQPSSAHQHSSHALQALFIFSSHIKLDAPSFASVVRHVTFAVVRQFVHFEHFPLGKQVAVEGVSHAELRITAPCHLKHIVTQTPERTAAVGQPAHYHLVANLQFVRQACLAEKHFALRCNRMSPLTEIPPRLQKSAKSSNPKKLAITFSVFLLGLLSWS